MFQSGTFHMDYHTILPRLTSFSILLWKTGNAATIYSVKCTFKFKYNFTKLFKY